MSQIDKSWLDRSSDPTFYTSDRVRNRGLHGIKIQQALPLTLS